jgi:hypothetical protein
MWVRLLTADKRGEVQYRIKTSGNQRARLPPNPDPLSMNWHYCGTTPRPLLFAPSSNRLHLFGAINLRHPLRPILYIQFHIHLHAPKPLVLIQGSCLHGHQTLQVLKPVKGFRDGGTTITTEGYRVLLNSAHESIGFWRAARNRKRGNGDHDISAKRTRGHFAAFRTVTEGLGCVIRGLLGNCDEITHFLMPIFGKFIL